MGHARRVESRYDVSGKVRGAWGRLSREAKSADAKLDISGKTKRAASKTAAALKEADAKYKVTDRVADGVHTAMSRVSQATAPPAE